MKKICKILSCLVVLITVLFVISYADYDFERKSIENNSIVEKDNKYGVIDESRKEIIALEYDFVYEVSNDFYIVKKVDKTNNAEEKYGAFDKNGNLLFDLNYDYIQEIAENEIGYYEYNNETLLATKKDKKWGVINQKGKEIIPFEYDRIELGGYREEVYKDDNSLLLIAYKSEKCGVIDINNNIVIPFEYDYIYWTQNSDPFIAKKDNESYYIDRNNKVLYQANEGQYLYSFSKGIAPFKENEKYGFIDKNMEIVVLPIYEVIRILPTGVSCAYYNDQWYLIANEGNEIIETGYNDYYKVEKEYENYQYEENTSIETNVAIKKEQENNIDIIKEEIDMAKEKNNNKVHDVIIYILMVILVILIIVVIIRTIILYKKNKNSKTILVGIIIFIILVGLLTTIIIIFCKNVNNFKNVNSGIKIDSSKNVDENVIKPQILNYSFIDYCENYNGFIWEEDYSNFKLDNKNEIFLLNLVTYIGKGAEYILEETETTRKIKKDFYYSSENSNNKEEVLWLEGVGGKIYYKTAVCNGSLSPNGNTLEETCKDHYEKLKERTIDGNCDSYFYGMNNLYIINGYADNKEIWKENSRVKKLKLTIDNKETYILELEDTIKPQVFEIQYKTAGILQPINMEYEVLEIYEGDKYKDTAITTLLVDTYSNMPQVRKLDIFKRESLIRFSFCVFICNIHFKNNN